MTAIIITKVSRYVKVIVARERTLLLRYSPQKPTHQGATK